MTLILIRHAHAGERRSWPFADLDRPLSVRGTQQAVGLTAAVKGLPTELWTSPYRRCRQTLAPLAAHTGLPVQEHAVLSPTAKAADLDRWLQHRQGAAVCTHGETLAALLARWHRRGTVSIPLARRKITKDATAKGGAWIVADTGQGPAAHYLHAFRLIDLTTPVLVAVKAS